MPDSLEPSRARRAWRFMSALGCLLGAIAILITAVRWTSVDTRQDRQAVVARQAICAIIIYSEDTAAQIREHPQRATPSAVNRFEKLVSDLQATGIACPRRPHK